MEQSRSSSIMLSNFMKPYIRGKIRSFPLSSVCIISAQCFQRVSIFVSKTGVDTGPLDYDQDWYYVWRGLSVSYFFKWH